MPMDEPLPLAVAESDVVEHAREMAPIARLAAHGMRRGQPQANHPRTPVYGPESATVFGMHVKLADDDPVLAACGSEVREGLRAFHLLLDVEFQHVRFHLLPIDRTRPACTVVWSMREDRAEIDFPSNPTNHDLAAIADRAAAMLDSVVDVSSDEAMTGQDGLEEAARTLRLVAFAQLGIDVDVTVLSNDHGSDLIPISHVHDDGDGRDVHFSLDLRKTLAPPRSQIKIGLGSTGRIEFDSPDGGEVWTWPSRFEYTVSRVSASSSVEDDGPVDVVEAMRVVNRFDGLSGPLAEFHDGSDTGDSDDEGGE